MPRWLHQYSTPLITGLFLASLVSGVALSPLSTSPRND